MLESLGSGVSPKVIVTCAGLAPREAPAGGSDDWSRAWADAANGTAIQIAAAAQATSSSARTVFIASASSS
jgi:hypothetical protein